MWGWKTGDGWLKYLYAVLFPLIIASVWGIFNVPGDPSRSGKEPVRVPGIVRLIIEWAVFGIAFWAMMSLEYVWLGIVFGIMVLGHYAFSMDRIKWLLSR